MLFNTGTVVLTRSVHSFVKEKIDRLEQIKKCLSRHTNGDWGNICNEDEGVNEEALKNDAKIVSTYVVDNTKIWIITEADRSQTTVLFPLKY